MELSDPDLKMTKGAKIKLLHCLSTFTDMFFPALLQKKKNPLSRTENYELQLFWVRHSIIKNTSCSLQPLLPLMGSGLEVSGFEKRLPVNVRSVVLTPHRRWTGRSLWSSSCRLWRRTSRRCRRCRRLWASWTTRSPPTSPTASTPSSFRRRRRYVLSDLHKASETWYHDRWICCFPTKFLSGPVTSVANFHSDVGRGHDHHSGLPVVVNHNLK